MLSAPPPPQATTAAECRLGAGRSVTFALGCWNLEPLSMWHQQVVSVLHDVQELTAANVEHGDD
jgi:hypothetical protein